MKKSDAERVRKAESAVVDSGGVYVPRTLLRGEYAEMWRTLRDAHGGMAIDALQAAIKAAVRK